MLVPGGVSVSFVLGRCGTHILLPRRPLIRVSLRMLAPILWKSDATQFVMKLGFVLVDMMWRGFFLISPLPYQPNLAHVIFVMMYVPQSVLHSNPVFSDLLPIDPSAARAWLSDGGNVQGADRVCDAVAGLAMAMCHSLHFLYLAGWSDAAIAADAPLTLTAAQVDGLRHLRDVALAFLECDSDLPSFGDLRHDLRAVSVDFSGLVVSARRPLVCDLVRLAWPRPGGAGVRVIAELVDGELHDDLADPFRCLLPRAAWLTERTENKVHASDEEWLKIVQLAIKLGIMGLSTEDNALSDQFGLPVHVGAMGVGKLKEVDGHTVDAFRSIATPISLNRFMRRLSAGISSLAYVGQLTNIPLEEGEALLECRDDLESCFGICAFPPSWEGDFRL